MCIALVVPAALVLAAWPCHSVPQTNNINWPPSFQLLAGGLNYLKPTAHGWKISKRQVPRPGNAAAGQNQVAINLQNENLLGGPPTRANQLQGPINRVNLLEKPPTNA